MKIIKMTELDQIKDWSKLKWTLTPEELKEAYALARASFTAEDLQRYTELDEGIPAEQLLAELEAMQREHDRKSQ